MAFCKAGRDVITGADTELLSPEPGSKDFRYLTDPNETETISFRLDILIENHALRPDVTNCYPTVYIFDREAVMDDYIGVFMPEVSKERLAAARVQVRSDCGRLGIMLGDNL
ncbi:MAG: hypothetical protein PCALPYG88_0669 [uncultured Paraburkholderia sp.]|nr:MAG: hypothetical protein PCALPYG88_0669 [uncultured Paraburkholderia sp.]